jgi:formylglycine-generating enzyme required for sulfatase activity
MGEFHRPALLAVFAGLAAIPACTGREGAGGGGDYVGPARRSLALCPADMDLVPAGAFLAGATAAQLDLPSYQPDIVNTPRARGVHETSAYCVDRFEYPGEGQRPSAWVTAVQAQLACEARGRRLCSEDEWSKACGGPLGLLFPYGDVHVPGLCHADVEEQAIYDQVLSSGTATRCRGPWGTMDLEGNVSEWVAGGPGEAERPAARGARSTDRWVLGGTMWPGVYGRGCQARHAHPLVAPVAGDDGFRCCRDPEIPYTAAPWCVLKDKQQQVHAAPNQRVEVPPG